MCVDPINRRHVRREQRPGTNTHASELSVLTSTRLQRSPSRAAACGKIIYGHCYFFVCPNVSFSSWSAGFEIRADSHQTDKEGDWFNVSAKWPCSFQAYTHKHSHHQLPHAHAHTYTSTHTHTCTCSASKQWEVSIISNSSSIANSFVLLLRYHHFSFFFSFHIHKKITSESVCRWKQGAREQGNKGWGGSDSAEMKTGDYWSTGNTGWIFDSVFCDVFLSENTYYCYIGVLRTCRVMGGGSTQALRIIFRWKHKSRRFSALPFHGRGSVGCMVVKLHFI